MPTTVEAIRTALAHHQAGRLREAEQVYRQVLAAEPQNAGAMHLLGLLACQSNRSQQGVEWITRAIATDGSQAVFHANLGEAFRGLNRLDDAQRAYRRALELAPDLAEAHNNLGTLLQAQGKLDEAAASYQRAIAVRPQYADAHNNLGTVCQAQGNWQQAIDCFQRAVQVDPNCAGGYHNLGVAYRSLDNLPAARAALQQAVERTPQDPAAHYSLAVVLEAQKEYSLAEAALRRALALRPAFAQAHSSLGNVLQAQGELSQAIACYQQALAVDPRFAEAYYNWGTALRPQNRLTEAAEVYRRAIQLRPDFADAHYNLGTVLQPLGRLDEAAAAYRAAIALEPEMALAHNNLGNIHKLQGLLDEAIACYKRAIAARPERVESYNNLGATLQQQGKLSETIECFQQALTRQPECAEAYNNLGNAYQEQARFDEAIDCYNRALELQADSPEAHYNRGLLYLSQGRFAEGWPDFQWRLKCQHYPLRGLGQKAWDGSPFVGQTLLVHAEQGFGDTLHFLRFLPQVRALGGTVLFEVQKPLVPLLECSGVEGLVAGGEPLPPVDLVAPLLELPRLLNMTRASLPAEVPYVTADPQLIDPWKARLQSFPGLKVGINWQGNSKYSYDRYRSIPLAEFAPLAGIEGVQLLSLQKMEGVEQLARVPASWGICDLGAELDEHAGAFMDTAAVMKSLDLVITSDTAIAHLAGALGVKVWLPLSLVSEWRWFLDGDDSPWYPSMRLFRQQQLGDWRGVFVRIAEALRALAAGR